MQLKILYFIILLCTFPHSIWASTSCAQVFDQLDSECTKEFQDKFKEASYSINKLEIGQVLFYQTSENVLGKLKIIGREANAGECTLYWESETFSSPKSYKTNTSISINNKVGLWSSREINLDYTGGKGDFILKRHVQENGKEDCRLEVMNNSKATFYAVMDDSPTITGNTLIYWASLVLIGAAFFIAAFNYLREEEKYNADVKFSDQTDENTQKNIQNQGLIVKYSQPIIKRYFVDTIARMKGIDKVKEKYKRPLANAGLLRTMNAVEFYSLKFLLVLAFPVLYLLARWLLEFDLPADYAIFAGVFGYFYPEIWIRSRIQRRREEMFLAMPFIVDLLALSIEAGLDFVAAISRVIEKAPPSALTDEFQIFIKEIKIGSSRGEALRQLSWRVDEISVNSFCATLIAADSVGASVGPVLKSISKELRNKRSALVEKKAAQAASKIMIPMILIILPAIMIVVFTPPLLEMMQ
jgi:tight adherence protein C